MDCRALLVTSTAILPPNPRKKPEKRSPMVFLGVLGRSRERLVVLGRHCSVVMAEAKNEEVFFGRGEEEKGKKGWVHFVGIGGSGLSALAMLAIKQGFEVSGSDLMWSSFLDKLYTAGARLFIGHSVSNIERSDGSGLPGALVVSSAVPTDNVEVAYANSVGIPVYKRDFWLRKITQNYNLIAVCGTHGKSTTAAMLSYVLHEMGDNLMAVIGANVPQVGISLLGMVPILSLRYDVDQIVLDKKDFPTEVGRADEYDCCFLGLSPNITVVTNVEWDHVDIFPDKESFKNTFRKFVNQIRVGGHLILCGDCAGACDLVGEGRQVTVPSTEVSNSPLPNYGLHVTTFGISTTNEWHASSITSNLQGGVDYVLHHKECPVTKVHLRLPGVHNVLNSLAVIATVVALVNDKKHINDTINAVTNHLDKFEGVSRRFELIGKVHGCHIYDDYAHHPAEVRAVLQAARQKFPNQALWVVFQPHTYSRLAALMNDFTTAFTNADYVIVTEIYAARETNIWNSDGRDLAINIVGPSSDYIPELEDVIEELAIKIPSSGNQETILLTLGAGDITTLGPRLLRRLQNRS